MRGREGRRDGGGEGGEGWSERERGKRDEGVRGRERGRREGGMKE